MLINVMDYASVQEALDAALDGDRLYFPGVQVYQAPPGGWIISKRLEIFGDGPGSPDSYDGSVLVPAGGATDHVLVLDPPVGKSLNDIYIHDLKITRRPGQSGTDGGSGVRLNSSATKKIANLRFERVAVSYMGDSGVSLLATDGGNGALVASYILCCEVVGCGKAGLELKFAFQTFLARCSFRGNGEEGCRANESECALYGVAFEGNNKDSMGLGRTQLSLDGCSIARVDACRFRGFGSPNQPACLLDNVGGAGQVGGSTFELDVFEPTAIAIDVGPTLNGSLMVLPNRIVGVGTAVRAQNLASGCVVLPQFVGVGTTTVGLPGSNDATLALPSIASPASNALAGLLPPEMSSPPTSGVQDGALYVDSSTSPAKLRVRAGVWKDVALLPPLPPISDLAVGTVKGRTSLTVFWQAPAGAYGSPVGEYVLKQSVNPITDQNFDLAAQVPTASPSSPGTPECANPQNLSPCTLYYFAIKYRLQCGLLSPISNLPSGSTRCVGFIEVSCP